MESGWLNSRGLRACYTSIIICHAVSSFGTQAFGSIVQSLSLIVRRSFLNLHGYQYWWSRENHLLVCSTWGSILYDHFGSVEHCVNITNTELEHCFLHEHDGKEQFLLSVWLNLCIITHFKQTLIIEAILLTFSGSWIVQVWIRWCVRADSRWQVQLPTISLFKT